MLQCVDEQRIFLPFSHGSSREGARAVTASSGRRAGKLAPTFPTHGSGDTTDCVSTGLHRSGDYASLCARVCGEAGPNNVS
jgi:hypothetical protein